MRLVGERVGAGRGDGRGEPPIRIHNQRQVCTRVDTGRVNRKRIACGVGVKQEDAWRLDAQVRGHVRGVRVAGNGDAAGPFNGRISQRYGSGGATAVRLVNKRVR